MPDTCSVPVNGTPTRVNALSLFQKDIKPAWEDEVNSQGGVMKIDFKSKLAFVQTIWDKLVLSIVSIEFDGVDMISGVRICDKSEFNREGLGIFRIEVWTKFNSTNPDMVNALKAHLETEYVRDMMIEDPDTKPLGARTNENNPADWIKKFTNIGDPGAQQRRGPPPADRGGRGGHNAPKQA